MKKTVRNILLWLKMLRYPIVIAVGVVLVTFVDEYSVMRNIQLSNEIKDTKEEISRYSQQYDRDTKKLRELRHSPRAVENVARERYFMKTNDEDVFVLSDDPREESNLMNDETAK